MRGTLSKIESNHNNLRTNDMAGEFSRLPALKERFVIYGESLTPGMNFREINTSPVQEVIKISETEYEFKTRNSHYKIVLDGPNA
jgi:hypothetical protein